MSIALGSKRTTAKPATDGAVFAGQVETLPPFDEMEIIERIAEAMPIPAFQQVSLHKTGKAESN